MSKEHKKHASMVKPDGGKFHRNELAFLGAPCGIIQKLCSDIAASLSQYNFGFVDADHSESKDVPVFTKHYTDKISYHSLSFHHDDLTYDFRREFEGESAVLVNGNHYKAVKQVVLIHEKKKESLQRKLDRLTDVQFFIFADENNKLYDFLLDHKPEYKNKPTYHISEIQKISQAINEMLIQNIPPVNGLVLAGGKSSRMGTDKASINYHGKPHSEYLAELIEKYCNEAYLSVRHTNHDYNYPLLVDSFTELGPFGGILSAFRQNPNSAWFSVATDVPFLDEEVISLLLEKRNPDKIATCFHNPETGFPEPLITIWEPRAYQRLLYFLGLGYSCPRKVLINSDIEEIKLEDHEVLFNANTPEEMETAKEKINSTRATKAQRHEE